MAVVKPEATQSEELPAKNGWEARSRQTRKKLLEAAFKIMAEVGIDSVSISAVAKEAGVTRPGAYYHFNSRDALLRALRESLDEEILKITRRSSTVEDPYSFIAEIAAEDERMIRLRVGEMMENGPAKDVLITERREAFKRLHEQGRLKPGVDPAMAGIIAASILVSGLLVVSGAKTKQERRKLAKKYGSTLYQILFNGALDYESYGQWPGIPDQPGAER